MYGFYRTVDGERQMIDVIISAQEIRWTASGSFDFSMLLNWFDGYRVFCADSRGGHFQEAQDQHDRQLHLRKAPGQYKQHRGYDIKTVDIGVSMYHKYVPDNFLNERLSFNELVTTRAPRTLVLKTVRWRRRSSTGSSTTISVWQGCRACSSRTRRSSCSRRSSRTSRLRCSSSATWA